MLKKIREFLNNKVANAVYALVASVLVHLIGNHLGNVNFEAIQYGDKTIIKQVPTGSLFTGIIAILIPFLLFWLLLNLVLPSLLQFLERIAYKTMPKYSIYEVNGRYRKIRTDVLETIGVFNKRKNDAIGYYFDCLEKIISDLNELYSLFVQAETQGILSSCFSDQYSEIGKRLSKYEFIGLIDLIDRQLLWTEQDISGTNLPDKESGGTEVLNDIQLARSYIDTMKKWSSREDYSQSQHKSRKERGM